jgi:hypothetical protein
MTMRTQDALVCQCGHEGHLLCKENDQPYSAMWEVYSLEGFDGGVVSITRETERPKDVLAAVNPCCPKCGRTGTVTYKKT